MGLACKGLWMKLHDYMMDFSNEMLDKLYDSLLKELEIIGKLMGGEQSKEDEKT
jgi:hypothetical protein